MNKDEIFCPNCGQKVLKTAQFCGNCGYNIAAYVKNKEAKMSVASSQSEQQTTATKKTPHRHSLKSKILWPLGILLLLLLVGGYLRGQNYYSQKNQVDRIVAAVTGQGNLREYVDVDDPSLKVTTANLLPTQKYFKTHKESLAKLKTNLAESGTYKTFHLEQSGAYFLLFPKYKLKIDASYVTVEDEDEAADIDLYQGNKKLFTTTDDTSSYKAGPYFPGIYSFKAKGKIDGKEQEDSAIISITKKSNEVELLLDQDTNNDTAEDEDDDDRDDIDSNDDDDNDDNSDVIAGKYSVSTEDLNRCVFLGGYFVKFTRS